MSSWYYYFILVLLFYTRTRFGFNEEVFNGVLDNALIDFNQVIQSAKTKLLLWGMSEVQINALAENKKATPTTTVYSEESGYITSIDVQEGDYVSEGGTIVQVADLSTLWAEAQIYTRQFATFNVYIYP
jgi:Cu(I)/Ag(I) efflux system membrane fusion protein